MNLNDDMSFFKNETEQIEYNSHCLKCPKECKQSFRAKIITCSEIKKEECDDNE